MGLDGVELVMLVESEFGITLSDREWTLIATVEDMVCAIEAKTADASNKKRAEERFTGLTSERRRDRIRQQVPLFYRLRQVLSDSVLVEKRLIRPDTELCRIIPSDQRVAVWQDLRDAGFELPPLGWSWFGRLLFPVSCLAVVVLAVGIAMQFAMSPEWVIILASPMLLVGWLTVIFGLRWMGRVGMLSRLCGMIPAYCATPARIIEHTARSTTSSSRSRLSEVGVDDQEVQSEAVSLAAQALCSRMAAIVQIEPSTLLPDTRLADIIPADNRFATFGELRAGGMPVPELESTTWGRIVAAAMTTIAVVIACGFFVLLNIGARRLGAPLLLRAAMDGLLLMLVVAVAVSAWEIVLGVAGRRQSWRLHGGIPREWETIERAAIWLAMCEWPARADDPDHVRIVQRVRELIAVNSGTPVEEIRLQSRLADLLD
ncbi:MAG: hypothetical protein IT430_03150 [Phycisphaerales bacterium]|nr:hypothetical protein [Phycisphaerales bacterium]